MAHHYWAVRPISHKGQNCRIEKAASPVAACHAAFGRDRNGIGFEYKDLGTRVEVLHSDKKRIALLTAEDGWIAFRRP